MTTKTEYYVVGRTSGWRRGPFTSLGFPVEAQKLANEKAEIVDVERVTITTSKATLPEEFRPE